MDRRRPSNEPVKMFLGKREAELATLQRSAVVQLPELLGRRIQKRDEVEAGEKEQIEWTMSDAVPVIKPGSVLLSTSGENESCLSVGRSPSRASRREWCQGVWKERGGV